MGQCDLGFLYSAAAAGRRSGKVTSQPGRTQLVRPAVLLSSQGRPESVCFFSSNLNCAREPFPALTDMTDIAGRTLHFDFAGYWLGFLVNMVYTMHRTDDFPHDLRKRSRKRARFAIISIIRRQQRRFRCGGWCRA